MKYDVYNNLPNNNDGMIGFMPPYQVSIIIPTLNNFYLTKNCIESINNAQLKINYEIIIADDGSTDETINIEKYYDNVRLIKTPHNMGFLLNVKNAVSYAQSEYIFLMNNDMIAKTKFLDILYETIIKNKNIGIVGAMMLYEDGAIQEVGASVDENANTQWNYNQKEYINLSKLYKVNYCSGCGMLFSKDDWDKVDGFDEQFAPAYYEDVDFCYTIKYKLRKKIVCNPNAQIYHLLGKTYSESANDIALSSRKKFLKKWEKELKKENFFRLIYKKIILYKQYLNKFIIIVKIKLT